MNRKREEKRRGNERRGVKKIEANYVNIITANMSFNANRKVAKK